MDLLLPGELAIRMGAAVVVGGVIGLERQRKHRPAGLRTMILISLGSAAFMTVAHDVVAMAGEGTIPGGSASGAADVSRALQGLIGGIGFLGAGAVIQNKHAVHGLTTAAAVWVTAAMGAACGLGLYSTALIATGFALFTLWGLKIVEGRFAPLPEEKSEGDGVGRERM